MEQLKLLSMKCGETVETWNILSASSCHASTLKSLRCFKKVIYQIHKRMIWEVMVVHSIYLLPIQKKVKLQTDERLQCCLTTLVESFLFRNEVLLECIDNTSLCNICWNQIHILSNENKELLTDNRGCKCWGNNLCLIDTKSSHKRSLLSTFYPWERDVFISSLFLQIALWRYYRSIKLC